MSNNKEAVDGSVLLDNLNLKMIKDLMSDANVKSGEIAKRYNTPLSTIQRRRTKLERTILKKGYSVDIRSLGWRQADLLISVEQGDSEEMAAKLLETYRGNISEASLRIGDPEINVMAETFYQSTEELHQLIEGIKSIPAVKSVEWSEIVKIVGTDNSRIVDRMFDDSNSTNR